MRNRTSPRKRGYDYTTPGPYFVTICTKDRCHYFGEVKDGKMMLNELGRYAADHWWQIPDHYPCVICDEFVCMPNHIHGILIIGDNTGSKTEGTQFQNQNLKGRNFLRPDENGRRTYKNTSQQKKDSIERINKIHGIQPKSGSLGAIIRGYKIGITKFANEHHIPFARQSRYHDHIIRNEIAYHRIKWYIQTNPESWKEDMYL